MRSNTNLNSHTDSRERAKENVPFGLASTVESYPLVVNEDAMGEVRFLRSTNGNLKKIEIVHKGEFERLGIPGGFSVESGASIGQGEFESVLRPKGGVLFTLNQVVNVLERYPNSRLKGQSGLLIRRHPSAWLKAARRCDVNDTEFLQYYRDCLPASLVDWASGCQRTESQILRKTTLGLTTVECQLVTHRFPDGALTADIHVFKYDTDSCHPELLAVSQGVVRRKDDSERVLKRISEVMALLESPDLSEVVSGVRVYVGSIFNYLSPSIVSLSSQSKRMVHTREGGIISEENRGSRVEFSIRSGPHKNASKIEFESNDKALVDTLFIPSKESSDDVVGTITEATSSGKLFSSLLHSNSEDSPRLVNITENLTAGLSVLQPCSLPPHIFTISELVKTYCDGCDWIGYSDIRFSPNLPLHGTRFAHGIFFKVWEGGCHQILLQLPGEGVISISPPLTHLSSKHTAFTQGGLSDVRTYVRSQLELFTIDPLYLLRHHLLSKSEVCGCDHRILNERAISQIQFLGRMLFIDAQRSDSDRMFPSREIHPLTLYVRSSVEKSTLRLNSSGPFSIQVTLLGEGLHFIEVIGKSSLARKVMTKRDERILASTGVPEQIGRCAERSYELLRRLRAMTMQPEREHKHRPPSRTSIWELIDSQLQEDV